MVAVASQIVHEQNFLAMHQVEIVVGSDRVVRVNIDGVCALRVRMQPACVLEADFLSSAPGKLSIDCPDPYVG